MTRKYPKLAKDFEQLDKAIAEEPIAEKFAIAHGWIKVKGYYIDHHQFEDNEGSYWRDINDFARECSWWELKVGEWNVYEDIWDVVEDIEDSKEVSFDEFKGTLPSSKNNEGKQ